MDMNIWDQEAELNLVLEEKLSEREIKKIKNKFGSDKSKFKKRKK
ncbi:MAG: hypothetical protein P1U46_03100 [Patescibacteria group bacterium]|nr:hypothetical protein [Patescibacteria group bacterium]